MTPERTILMVVNMAFFGRSFILFGIALVVIVGALNNAMMIPAFAQDAVVEAVPSVVEDDEAVPSIAEDGEAIPYIAEDDEEEEPSMDGEESGKVSTTVAKSDGNFQKAMMDFLILNWHLVAGIVGAIVILPILSRIIFRRKDPVAKYAAASMAKGNDVLPEARPADPMAIDGKKTYAPDGSVTPIAELERQVELHGQAELGEVTGYAGSSVAPGAPGYPAISDITETIPFDDGAQSLEFVDDEPLVVLDDEETTEQEDTTEPPAPDMDDAFEFAEPKVTEEELLSDEVVNNDDDIEEFEAANAKDPFEVAEPDDAIDEVEAEAPNFEELEPETVDAIKDENINESEFELETEDAQEELAMHLADEEDVADAMDTVEEIDEEAIAAEVVTEEFSDAGDEGLPVSDESSMPADALANGVGFGAGLLGAAGVAAASQTVPAAIDPSSEAAQVIEVRITAIQEALLSEQQRTAELGEEQRQLRDLVAQLRMQLASSGNPATTIVPEASAVNVPFHAFDDDAIVQLQSENRELTLKLQEEQAQRQASELELRSLESSVKSLDARLNLVNSERDNLAKLLYAAKQQVARQPR